jgi:hypothetical protein
MVGSDFYRDLDRKRRVGHWPTDTMVAASQWLALPKSYNQLTAIYHQEFYG